MNFKKFLIITLLATSLTNKATADDAPQKPTEHYQNLTNFSILQSKIDFALVAFAATALTLSKNNSQNDSTKELATYSTCIEGLNKFSAFTSDKGLRFIHKKLTAEKESLNSQGNAEKFNVINTIIEQEITRRANLLKA